VIRWRDDEQGYKISPLLTESPAIRTPLGASRTTTNGYNMPTAIENVSNGERFDAYAADAYRVDAGQGRARIAASYGMELPIGYPDAFVRVADVDLQDDEPRD
jgi:hypothetical protein